MSEEDKKPIKLVRMPDGSMRPETDIDTDIGDVWSTQHKIRANETQQEQLTKQQRKQQPKKKLLSKLQKKRTTAPPASVIVPQASVKQASAAPKATYKNQVTSNKAPVADSKTTVVVPSEIAISVTMPKVRLPKAPKRIAKKALTGVKSAPRWVYALVALAALPAFLITFAAINRNNNTNKPAVQGESKVAVPDFQTVTPNGDITDTTSQKINYDASKKVASFTDKLNGYEVTVSMQPIPSTFKPNIGDNVKKVAEQFSANTVLSVDNGSAYLGTSPKGPQSLVGYRGDLLVFMKSERKIEDKAWSDYFNSLK